MSLKDNVATLFAFGDENFSENGCLIKDLPAWQKVRVVRGPLCYLEVRDEAWSEEVVTFRRQSASRSSVHCQGWWLCSRLCLLHLCLIIQDHIVLLLIIYLSWTVNLAKKSAIPVQLSNAFLVHSFPTPTKRPLVVTSSCLHVTLHKSTGLWNSLSKLNNETIKKTPNSGL